MEARLLQQTFMGIAHMTRMKSDRESFKQNFWSCSPEKMGFGQVEPTQKHRLGFVFHFQKPLGMPQIGVLRINRPEIKDAQKSHCDLQHVFSFHNDLLLRKLLPFLCQAIVSMRSKFSGGSRESPNDNTGECSSTLEHARVIVQRRESPIRRP